MRLWVIVVVSLVGIGLGVANSTARCVSYEPARVTLVGVLISRTLPGPPNYRSIAHGDLPETIFLLRLNEPICVSGDPSSRLNRKSHSRVMEVQLLARDVDPKRFLNKQVRASGSLFGAHMDYHRTPVLLTVVRLRAA